LTFWKEKGGEIFVYKELDLKGFLLDLVDVIVC
jgi:hypothetical protein